MMKAVLKTLAISFGGGLALGAGLRLAQGPATKPRSEPPVDLDRLLSRLKSVESRIVEMESSGRQAPEASAHGPAVFPEKTLAAFESRLAAQFSDVEHLRGEIHRVDERLGELDAQLPILIQSTVDVRFAEVERKLQREFEETQSRSMAAFVDTLQTKVVERISTLETNLAEQSHVIGTLRDASVRSDENLQKMLAGIERLVDQTLVHQTKAPQPPAPAASPPPQPSAAEPVITRAEVFPAPQAVPMHAVLEEHEPAARQISPAHSLEIPRTVNEPARTEEPVLVSEASISEELFRDAPVLARVPEISPLGAGDVAHPNGASFEPAAGPAKPAAEALAPDSIGVGQPPEPAEPAVNSEESYEWVNRIGLELLAPRPKPRIGWRVPLAVGLVAGLMLIAGLLYSGAFQRYFGSTAPQPQTSTLASTAPSTDASVSAQNADNLPSLEQRASSKPADPGSLVELAREYQRRKDWAKAESAYRSALEAGPGNRDASLGLSDVLYQEQKYEESAAVLNKLSSEKSR